MAKYILGIDEGTTGARAFVIDDQCEVLGLASAELTQHYPRPGWIEHDPMEILNVQLEVIRAALRQAKLQPSDLSAVALTNQRETGIVWEKDTGRPIYNAVVWASRQTVGVVEQWVEKGHGDMIEQRTGLIPDAYYTASKIRFILDAVPGAQERAERGELLAGTVDTWLIWNLTGRRSFVTEFSNASRTMMFNLETRRWDDDLLDAYNIPKRMLAEIGPSDAIVGDIGPTFGADIPIASNLGDQQAGLFGQAAFAPGQSKMTYGTAGVLNINCGEQPQRVAGLTPSMAWGVQGTVAYEIEGVLFAMGKTMQWLRDDLKLIHAAPDSEWYAGQVPSTDGVYLIPAFTGLSAPDWDPYARAAIIGISNATTRLHVIRAAVESMVYQTRDVVEAAVHGGAHIDIPELRVDGGAVKNNFLCQLQADMLGIPVVRPKIAEATVFGTMLMAGLSTGIFTDLPEVAGMWKEDRRFEPAMSRDQADSMYAGWRAARELTKGWARNIRAAHRAAPGDADALRRAAVPAQPQARLDVPGRHGGLRRPLGAQVGAAAPPPQPEGRRGRAALAAPRGLRRCAALLRRPGRLRRAARPGDAALGRRRRGARPDPRRGHPGRDRQRPGDRPGGA